MTDVTLETLASERAIRRMVSAYCDAVNRLDADAAGALFAPDAVIRIADYPEIAGREAIAAGLRQTFAASGFLFQQCDTGLLDIDGTTARARLSVLEANRKQDEDRIGLIFGLYEDEYVRLDEGWRFARRRYTLRLRTLIEAEKIDAIPGFAPLSGFRA
jgi:ketosteroid isomerase-like protein